MSRFDQGGSPTCRAVLLAAAIFFCLCGVADAKKLNWQLTHYNGVPYARKQVALRMRQELSAPIVSSTITDHKGRFAISGLNPHRRHFVYVRDTCVGVLIGQYDFEATIPPLRGDTIPNLILRRLDGSQSEGLLDSISDDQHTVLVFWASWAGPSVKTLKAIVQRREANEHWADAVRFVAINIDTDFARFGELVDNGAWSGIEQLWAGEEGHESLAAEQFGVLGVPHMYILSPKGRVIASGTPREIDWVNALNALLGYESESKEEAPGPAPTTESEESSETDSPETPAVVDSKSEVASPDEDSENEER